MIILLGETRFTTLTSMLPIISPFSCTTFSASSLLFLRISYVSSIVRFDLLVIFPISLIILLRFAYSSTQPLFPQSHSKPKSLSTEICPISPDTPKFPAYNFYSAQYPHQYQTLYGEEENHQHLSLRRSTSQQVLLRLRHSKQTPVSQKLERDRL